MPALTSTVRIIILLVAVCAVLAVVLIAGWADDKAKPGTGGRAPVPTVTSGAP